MSITEELFQIETSLKQKPIPDPEFPISVVEAFSKIWQLWMNYPVLRLSIKRNTFHEIYASMTSYFGNLDEFNSRDVKNKYICDLCDEEILLLNNDMDFSTKVHEQTVCHVEAVKTIEDITKVNIDPSENVAVKQEFENKKPEPIIKSEIKEIDHYHVAFIREIKNPIRRMYCQACNFYLTDCSDTVINSHIAGHDHKEMVQMLMQENPENVPLVLEMPVRRYPLLVGIEIDFIERWQYCSVCHYYIHPSELKVKNHLHGYWHGRKVENLKSQNKNPELTNPTTSETKTTSRSIEPGAPTRKTDVDNNRNYYNNDLSGCRRESHFFNGNHGKDEGQHHLPNHLPKKSKSKLLKETVPKAGIGKGDPFIGEVNIEKKCFCSGCKCYVDAVGNGLENHIDSDSHQFVLHMYKILNPTENISH